MSSKNNVNKDFYTLAGRDRPNEHVIAMGARGDADEPASHRGGPRPNFIPGAAPVGEAPARDEREAQTSASSAGTRSGSQKQATARRGGKAPAKSGAFGNTKRQPKDTAAGKSSRTRPETGRRSRRRAA